MALSYPYTIDASTDATAAEVQGNFDAIKTYVDTLGAGAEDTTWRTVHHLTSAELNAAVAAGDYVILPPWGAALPAMASVNVPELIYLDDADHTLSGETPTMRLRAVLLTNSVAPAITYTFGLHQITAVAGAAGTLTHTVNTTRVTNSGAAHASPAASTIHVAVSTAFIYPADGLYTFGVVTSGTGATNANIQIHLQLQVKVT